MQWEKGDKYKSDFTYWKNCTNCPDSQWEKGVTYKSDFIYWRNFINMSEIQLNKLLSTSPTSFIKETVPSFLRFNEKKFLGTGPPWFI